jgi:predicted nucleic acid-binding protein
VVPLVSRATYEEFRGKLGDPRFGISPAARDTILAEYLHYAEYTRDVPDSGDTECRDEKDKPFVDLAMAKEADAIVSADLDLLDCNGLWDFPVLNVTEFIQRFA